jgi:hypothetical protein
MRYFLKQLLIKTSPLTKCWAVAELPGREEKTASIGKTIWVTLLTLCFFCPSSAIAGGNSSDFNPPNTSGGNSTQQGNPAPSRESEEVTIEADGVLSHKEQQKDYWVHIYKNPSYDDTPPEKRSVLLLGYNSTADVVKEQRMYVNPATGQPYDAVIGTGSPVTWDEVNRVFVEDSFNADDNAEMVGASIEKEFGGKIQAGTLDMHSNGNAVGIALLDKNIGISGVKKLNMMEPDEGFGAHNLDRDRLAAIVAGQGIRDIELYVTSGDPVPKAGEKTGEIKDLLALENISAKGIPLREHDYDYFGGYSGGLPIKSHFLTTCLVLRAFESGDPDIMKAVRDSVTAAIFDEVVSKLRPKGQFRQQLAKTMAALPAQETLDMTLIKALETDLQKIQSYQTGLDTSKEDQAIMNTAAGKLMDKDRQALDVLNEKIKSIDQALAWLVQIIGKPPDEFDSNNPGDAYHPPAQPPP